MPKEEALSHIRVLAFGYDANIVNLNGSTSLNTLFEHSINLLNALSRERRQDAVSSTVVDFQGTSSNSHSFSEIVL